MKTTPSLLALFLAALAVPACSSSDAKTDETHSEGAGGSGGDGGGDAGLEEDAGEDPEEDAGAGGSGGSGGSGGGSSETCGIGAPICSEVDDGFDEDAPGFFGSFDLGVTLMMGQRFGYVAAYFQDTAREDFCKEAESKIPLDTCVVVDPSDAPAPQCSSDDQCSAEQKCLPRTRDGNPIACTEHCQTPRSPMDIGPIEVTGFSDGAIQLEADPQQSNGYVVPGGGTIPASSFAFGTTYVVKGDGDLDQGVGGFEAEVELGPELAITSPEMEDGTGFPPLPALPVDPTAALTLEWSGAVADGELMLELSAADMNATRGHIKCRVKDDGEFTISAEMIEALDLGDTAFLNNLNVERVVKGSLTGDGFTRYEVNSRQVLIVNMAKKKGE